MRTIQPGGRPPISVGPAWMMPAAFSGDGKTLVFCCEAPLAIWSCDVQRGKPRRTAYVDSVDDLAVGLSPYGALVAMADSQNRVTLWDPQTGRRRTALPGPAAGGPRFLGMPGDRPLVFSPDETILAGVGVDGTVTIWDVSKFLPRTPGEADEGDASEPGDRDPKAKPGPAAEKPATPAKPEEERKPQFRTWTSADGRFTVEAEFVKAIGGKVTLRKRDGTKITVPMKKLSEDDRRVIRGR